MQHLLRRKITHIVISILFCPFVGQAQYKELNLPDHDDKPFHFDIAIGFNRSHFSFTHHPQFFAYANSDSVMSVESINSSGISLGLPYVKHLNEHFSLRTNIFNLIFTQKAFEYRLKYPDRPIGEDSITMKKVESVSVSFPLQVKFMSDRIDNFRVYMFGGGKAEYDFQANAGKKNADNLIKLKRWDIGVEAGLGFHFYMPMVVLIPELKIGWGLSNLHSRNSNLKYSNVIDKINSRTITFSLMIE